MCTAAVRLRGEQRLNDPLEVFVEGEMPLVRVKLQAASRYPLGQMLRVVRGHEEVGFSMVKEHVDPAYLFEAERPWSYLTQVVVDPARSYLSHGLLERLDEDRSDLGPFERPAIGFWKLLRKPCEDALWIFVYSPSGFTARRGQFVRCSPGHLDLFYVAFGHPLQCAGAVQHAEPAHNSHPPEPLGHQHAKGEHVRSSPREAERREALQAEVVGHPHEVPGAVEKAGLGPGIRVTVAGPIDADEEQPLLANPLRVVEARGEA